MISWSKCRPLNRSCAEVGSVIPAVIVRHRAFQQFAPEPSHLRDGGAASERFALAERQGAISRRSHYWKLAGPTLVERGNDILLRLQELAFEMLHFVQVLDTYFKFPVKFIPSLHGPLQFGFLFLQLLEGP
jgi:hypothetical protein